MFCCNLREKIIFTLFLLDTNIIYYVLWLYIYDFMYKVFGLIIYEFIYLLFLYSKLIQWHCFDQYKEVLGRGAFKTVYSSYTFLSYLFIYPIPFLGLI